MIPQKKSKDLPTGKIDKKKILEMLDDDDEFEEFENHNWEVDNTLENEYKWAVDWDDDLEDDNFINELESELKKH